MTALGVDLFEVAYCAKVAGPFGSQRECHWRSHDGHGRSVDARMESDGRRFAVALGPSQTHVQVFK
jgi:hypothetical protein